MISLKGKASRPSVLECIRAAEHLFFEEMRIADGYVDSDLQIVQSVVEVELVSGNKHLGSTT